MSEDKKIEVRCPSCQSLLLKLMNCLAGEKYIEIKCRRCKEVVMVP